MKTPSRPSRIALASALVLLAGGCAVMTIDVDVYKGAMANHEDVQSQQMAAMAIGAKPLLIQLRDVLETDGIKSKIERLRKQQWYRPGYVPSPKKPRSDRTPAATSTLAMSDSESRSTESQEARVNPPPEGFERRQAERVNGILSLYEDQFDEEGPGRGLAQSLRKLEMHIANYDVLIKRLLKNEQEDKEYWKWLEPLLKTEDPGAQLQESAKPQRLGPAIKALLYPDGFAEDQVQAEKPIAGTIRREENLLKPYIAEKSPEIRTRWRGAEPFDPEEHIGAFAAFEWLAKPENAQRLAQDLLKESATDRDRSRFTERVTRIANAFVGLYETFDRALVEILEFIVELGSSEVLMAPSEKYRIIETIASKGLSRLVIPSLVLASVTNANVPDWIVEPFRLNMERRFADRGFPNFLLEADWDLEGVDRAGLNSMIGSVIADLLVERPEETGLRLLQLHGTLKSNGYEPVPGLLSESVERYAQGIGRTDHGLARGPSLRGAEERQIRESFADFLKMIEEVRQAVSAGGLERGRLPQGLETLIEDYIRTTHEYAGHDSPLKSRTVRDFGKERIREQREKLLEALVRFAEKVLFIANNETLFQEEKAFFPSIGDSVDRMLFRGRPSVNAYTRVLQAVGNSILAQADELAYRTDHEDKLVDAKKAELRALDLMLNQDRRRALDDLFASRNAAIDEIEQDLAETKDDLGNAEKIRDGEIKNAKTHLDRERKEVERLRAAREILLEDKDPNGKRVGNLPVIRAGATTDSLSYATLLIPILRSEHANEAPGSDRRTSLALTVKTLQSYIDQSRKKLEGIVETTWSKVANRLRGKIVEQELFAADMRRNQFKQMHDRILRNDHPTSRTIAAHHLQIDKLEKEIEAKKKLLEKIKELMSPLLGPAQYPGGKEPSAEAAVWQLIALLERERDSAGGDDAKKKEMTAALEFVQARLVPITRPPKRDYELTDKKAVLDELVSILRYELIAAERAEGADSRYAGYIRDAILTAYNQRGGMAYIRPAAAYLRTSFPSTSLQRDAALGSTNMLDRHALRQLPFAEFLRSKDDYRTLQEIDKQFWQSVNRIRVAGVGNTNYVVAKDDIGNWYVKNYSADPKDIIKSAKSLAMFSMGPAMGADLIGLSEARAARREAVQAAQAANAPLPEAAPSPDVMSVRERMFNSSQELYWKQTQSDYNALVQSRNSLNDKVKTAWNGNQFLTGEGEQTGLNDLAEQAATTQLSGALVPLRADGTTPQPAELTPTERVSQILEALNQMRRYHGALAAAIGETDLTKPARDALKTAREEKEAAEKKKTELEAKLKTAQKERDDAANALEDAEKLRDDAIVAASTQDVLNATEAVVDERRETLEKKEGGLGTAQTDLQEAEETLSAADETLNLAEQALGAAKKSEASARRLLTETVRAEITKFLDRRGEAIDRFETAVTIIGEAGASASN